MEQPIYQEDTIQDENNLTVWSAPEAEKWFEDFYIVIANDAEPSLWNYQISQVNWINWILCCRNRYGLHKSSLNHNFYIYIV